MLDLDGHGLTFEAVDAVARRAARVRLSEAARARMQRSHAWVAAAARGDIVDGEGEVLPVYGVNTGYGSLARLRIAPGDAARLSWNLVRSHAAGVGPRMPDDTVRAMMLLRANALAKGASGCRPELVDALLAMLAADVIPEIPSQGSCGSSGDLAPLSHLALAVFRDPDGSEDTGVFASVAGVRLPVHEAMERAGIDRLVPGPKEGLAMNNGAQLTTAIATLACVDADVLIRVAEVAAAMSWEAMRGVTRALAPGVHALRPYPGALACASNLRRLMEASTLTDSVPGKVQDAYALRCTPQILGAVRDAVTYAAAQVRVELNAATDNPLILVDAPEPNKAFSAGLFHGEPVGLAADHLKLALCELGALSERRIFRLTTGMLSARLPPLLAERAGLGLMAPQASAAALVAENRSLAWPASADSIPTCEDQEDHVAMSTTAARRAAEVLVNARQVVAIELLSAAHGLWWRLHHEGGATGTGTGAALEAVEAVIGHGGGEAPGDDLARLADPTAFAGILTATEQAVGPLLGVLGD